MPAPTTSIAFLDLVRKSGLVDPERLNTALRQLESAGPLPTEPKLLAGALIRIGLLTFFQAEQFLKGKWRGFTIGKYDVLERLGIGGTGIVYLCQHRFMRRRVAVKVLASTMADNPYVLERFYREGQAVAALDHPNIVRAHDIDTDGTLHFLVMEYVDGSGLDRVVRKLGPLDVNRAAHYIRQAAYGLAHAHKAGLVHRDIKPANLLLDRQGVVKILDMGLARFFEDKSDNSANKYAQLLGTVDFLAPEQAIQSDRVDIRADIYSLGATFHFLLSGRPPFDEGTLAQKLIWHQVRHPRPLCELRPEVPKELAEVVAKMMAKEPEQRYQDPAAVIEALAPWTQEPIPPLAIPESSRLSPAARRPLAPGGGHPPLIPAVAPRSSGVLRRGMPGPIATPPTPSTEPGEAPSSPTKPTQQLLRPDTVRMVLSHPTSLPPQGTNGVGAEAGVPQEKKDEASQPAKG